MQFSKSHLAAVPEMPSGEPRSHRQCDFFIATKCPFRAPSQVHRTTLDAPRTLPSRNYRLSSEQILHTLLDILVTAVSPVFTDVRSSQFKEAPISREPVTRYPFRGDRAGNTLNAAWSYFRFNNNNALLARCTLRHVNNKAPL